jgi:hypothetical protein
LSPYLPTDYFILDPAIARFLRLSRRDYFILDPATRTSCAPHAGLLHPAIKIKAELLFPSAARLS